MTAANVQRTGVNIGPKAPTRRDDNGERGSGSFDDVLSRSMGADRQGSRVPEVNSPSPQPARRKDDTDTSEPATAKHPDFVPEAAASTTTAPASSSVREPGATSGSTGSLDAGKDAAAGKPRTLSAGQVSKAGASQTAMGLTPDRDALTTSAEAAAGSAQVGLQPATEETSLLEALSRYELQTADQKSKLKSDRTEDPKISVHDKIAAASGLEVASADAAALSIAAGTAGSASTGDSASVNTGNANGALPITAWPAPGAVGQPTPDAAPVTPAPAYMLRSEVGSSEWGKALGQQMIHLAGPAGQQTAELQLNPPGLGPLRVTLTMNDQQLQAIFMSGHASVRSAVEAALPQLRTSLADSGINLGDTSVSSGDRQQSAFGQNQNRQPGYSIYQTASRIEAAAAESTPTIIRLRAGISVDTYA